MEWYEWVMMFGGTALVGLIIGDVYILFKSRSKKALDKHKQEKEEQQVGLIRAVVKEEMATSCSNFEVVKEKLTRIEKDMDELKPMKNEILQIKEEIRVIKTEDIPLLKVANRDSLRNQLLTCFKECTAKGYRTTEDIRNFEYMYDSYTKLNGNSFMVDIAKQFDHIEHKVN